MKKKTTKSVMGRPKIKRRSLVKTNTITLRINDEQDAWLEAMRDLVSEKLKIEVTKTWLIMSLVDFGRPHFEEHHGIVAAKKKPKAG